MQAKSSRPSSCQRAVAAVLHGQSFFTPALLCRECAGKIPTGGAKKESSSSGGILTPAVLALYALFGK